MRRYDLANLEGLDPDTRAAAETAARRAGLSLEDWVTAIMARPADRQEPAVRPARRPPGDELDLAIARLAKGSRRQADADPNAVSAAGQERPSPDHASRTAVALESMAMWMEQAEERLNETARSSAEHQDRMASALSQALTVLKGRLDTVERRVVAEPAPARIEFPVQEAMKALSPLADTLVGLRTDVSRLAKRLDQPTFPAVDEIRGDIERLRTSMDGLATRSEIATLDETLRLMSRDLERGPSSKDLLALAGSVAGLQRQVQDLSGETGEGVRRYIGAEIDLITEKLDRIAGTGIDRTVVDTLGRQIADLREDLASRAEPQQIERLSGEVTALTRQIAELRAEQVGRSDFATLKNSLEDVCAALNRSVAVQEAGKVPEQLQDMSRRLDVLVSRSAADPVDLGPIAAQLAALTDRMTGMVDSRLEQNDTANVLLDRLSSEIQTIAEAAPAQRALLVQRFDRIENELRQVGQQADTSTVELMLRSLEEKLDRVPAQGPALDVLEQRVGELATQISRAPEPLTQALESATAHLKTLQSEAALIAERAAKAALSDVLPSIPHASDLDALKAGFVELKALQTRADKRTQQTLQAIYDAIETLVARFTEQGPADHAAHRLSGHRPQESLPSADRLEAAVRRLHAAALSQIEEIAANTSGPAPGRTEAPRSMAGAPRGAASLAAQDENLGLVRANFIAAARRASQSLPPAKSNAAEPNAPHAAAETSFDDEAEKALHPVPSLIERIRRTLEAHRRPLLFSLGLLILAAGATQILWNGSQASPPGEAAVEAKIRTSALASPPGETIGRAAGSPTNETSLFQPSSLVDSLTSTSLTPAQFVADPAMLGEIPAGIPAELRQAALSGNAASIYEIAVGAAEGRGVPQDPALAVRLLERAAQSGLVLAQARLAMMYDRGIGTARDAKLAETWYRRAAEGGNVRAMHNLATLLAAGVNGKPDYSAALQWYREAAQAGVRDSQFNLGVLYATGVAARKDLAKAYHWFALASAQGDQDAAKKRDEIKARLSEAELTAAKALIGRWHPRAVDPAVNEAASATADRTAALSPEFDNRS